MSGYKCFAEYYDRLTDNVDYQSIAALCHKLVEKYSSEHEVVLDIACGTGSLSVELAKYGYDVIGIDLSDSMLSEAMEKSEESGLAVQFLKQDMTSLDLWGAADAAVCVLDSLNHLDSMESAKKMISSTADFVCDGGLFIFDVNTRHKHRDVLANNAFNFDRDGFFCAWQNELHEDDSVSVYLDFFEENEDGLYSRYSEDFKEIILDEADIEKALDKSEFELIGKYDGFSENKVNEKTERIMYVCRRRERC